MYEDSRKIDVSGEFALRHVNVLIQKTTAAAADVLRPSPSKNHQDWFDDQRHVILSLLHEKNDAHDALLRNPNSASLRQRWKELRNKVQTDVRQMENKRWTQKTEEIQRFADTNDTQKFLRSYTPGATPPSLLRYDTRYYFNVRSKADISQLNLPQLSAPLPLVSSLNRTLGGCPKVRLSKPLAADRSKTIRLSNTTPPPRRPSSMSPRPAREPRPPIR